MIDLLRELLVGATLNVADIGARGGIHPRWLPFQSVLHVTAFEPDPDECALLNRHADSMPYRIRYLPVALGSEDGCGATLHICRDPGSSSLYRPNHDYVKYFPYGAMLDVMKTQPVILSRLDTVLAREGVVPDVVKVDAQGAELDILTGAGKVLDGVLLVEAEVEFAPQYAGQPLFADLDQFMRRRGFALRGLKRSVWRRDIPDRWRLSARGGQLMHADALYVNSLIEERSRQDCIAAVKALLALSAYGQDDLVLAMLADPSGPCAAMPEGTRRDLASRLTRAQRSPMSWLPERLFGGLANRRLRRLVDSWRGRSATDWHDSDFY